MARTCHRNGGRTYAVLFWRGVCFRTSVENEISYKSNRVDRRSTATSVEDEEQHQLCRMAPTILSAMQVFTAITAIVPRFLPGGGETAEEWAFISMYVLADFSPLLILFLARRSCLLLGILAILIVPIFCGRAHYSMLFLASTQRYPSADWSMWANDFFGLFLAPVLIVWTIFRLTDGR
jgi:hypothetical protein